jgi:hypothetical protein
MKESMQIISINTNMLYLLCHIFVTSNDQHCVHMSEACDIS